MAEKHFRTRRAFLAQGLLFSAAAALPSCGTCKAEQKAVRLKTVTPKNAAVVWYSQTGNTRRIGLLIADRWRRAGLKVITGDIRETGPDLLPQVDLLVVGTPVFYTDVPLNVRWWLNSLKDLHGIPAAAYVTYGGTGHNQHNTACSLLEDLRKKGAVPMGISCFGSMSSFAPTWSTGNTARVLAYRDLPNAQTFQQACDYGGEILEHVKKGKEVRVHREFSGFSLLSALNLRWWTKLMIGDHFVDPDTCIRCGTCVETCPVNAIDPDTLSINHKKCLACMGCVNNCPVSAQVMTFTGSRVVGYHTFCRQHGLHIKEPKGCPAGGEKGTAGLLKESPGSVPVVSIKNP